MSWRRSKLNGLAAQYYMPYTCLRAIALVSYLRQGGQNLHQTMTWKFAPNCDMNICNKLRHENLQHTATYILRHTSFWSYSANCDIKMCDKRKATYILRHTSSCPYPTRGAWVDAQPTSYLASATGVYFVQSPDALVLFEYPCYIELLSTFYLETTRRSLRVSIPAS